MKNLKIHMDTMLATISEALLAPGNIEQENVIEMLHSLQKPGIDYADLYFQQLSSESWFLEDAIVKDAAFSLSRGVGVRAVNGAKTGFAYSDEIALSPIQKAITAVSDIIASGQEKKVHIISNLPIKKKALYSSTNPLTEIAEKEKVDLLKDVYAEILRLDHRIVHAAISLVGKYEMILIACDDGCLAYDIRPLVRMDVNVILAEGERREKGHSGGGGRCGYNFFLQKDTALKYAREAVRIALVNLKAIPAPVGNMPVVLGPGWPGVLLHEAVGHGLEADFIRKGTSVFSGRLGEKVASSVCTIVDDGSLPGKHRGSSHIDDEGTQTQYTTLIEKGILRSYMQDKLNAHLLDMKPTGNGRRESYASIPIPRMTNTYMLTGDSSPEEIIASIENGLYAVNFSSGQVDITSGNFVFTTSEAYLIEHGRVTSPVKEAALIGNGPEVLTKISLVGDDLALDPGIGTCGKDGQSVPVNVGQPTLKVDELTVGGTR